MRHLLATLVYTSMLGGCSLIYNPSNLPDPTSDDAGVDAQIILDADPSMLQITRVTPSILVEGQGTGGSRPAILVVHGAHFVKSNITVTLAAASGSTKTPTLTIDTAMLDVSSDGNMLAVPVTVPVDAMLGAGETIMLDVTISQDGLATPVTFSGGLMLKGLPELTGTAPALAGGVHEYSIVDITNGISAAANTTEPVRVRSRSSITIAGATTFDGANGTQNPGPAGGRGGAGGPGSLVGNAPGSAGEGPAGGMPSGGGGRFTGDDQLTSLGALNRSSGGAGGNGGSLGSAGGVGGGGGGSLEITADGDLAVGSISAKGATGTSGTASPGGGGSGGIVLLRAAGSVMAGLVAVTGGSGTSAPGAAGRVRVDAGTTIAVTTDPSTTPYRGPVLVPGTPLIVRSDKPMLTVVGRSESQFTYFFNNDDGSDSQGPFDVLIPQNGTATVTPAKSLFRGTNQFCVVVVGGSPGTSEARNCVEIVYLYAP